MYQHILLHSLVARQNCFAGLDKMMNNDQKKFDLKDCLSDIKILRHVSEFPREQWLSYSGHLVRRFNEGILVFILLFATKHTLRHNIL